MLQREDDFRPTRGELPAAFGRAGLHDDRASLRTARRRQRTARPDPLPLVIGIVNLARVGIDPALAIIDDGVRVPGIPQCVAGFHHLVRVVVPVVAVHQLVQAEVLRLARIGRGHHVPCGTSAADMVERGEGAGDMEWVVERGRQRSRQTNVACLACHGGEQQQRVEEPHLPGPAT